MKNQSPLEMLSHQELVRQATDLLSAETNPEICLPSYDAALASNDDVALVQFCRDIKVKIPAPRVPRSRAARAGQLVAVLSVAFGGTAAFGATVPAPSAQALHHFAGGADGRNPFGGVISDAQGNLYGTTVYSGAYTGTGQVFELTPPVISGGSWTKTILHQMNLYVEGGNPFAGLAIDASGNLYGTNTNGGPLGFGTVYELSPPATQGAAWSFTVLYSFTNGSDGGNTGTGVVIDANGDLYGSTPYPEAAIYKLSRPAVEGDLWTESTLYAFSGGVDGRIPGDPYLTLARNGVIYGSTISGGQFGDGTVYQLVPPATEGSPWVETVLYSFTGAADGIRPILSAIGSIGQLYGTTDDWGTAAYGSVFEIVPPSYYGAQPSYRLIWKFSGGADGAAPSGVIKTAAGSLIGGAKQGGILPSACQSSGIHPGCGVLFELKPPAAGSALWSEKTLFSFTNNAFGGVPQGLVLLQGNTIYETTSDIDQDNNELGHGSVVAVTP